MHPVMLLAGSPAHPMRQSTQVVETDTLVLTFIVVHSSRLTAKVFTVSAV